MSFYKIWSLLLNFVSLHFLGLEEQKRYISETSTAESALEEKPVQNVSRFGENQSTIVSRVPNKSVEDLYHADCSGCQLAQGLSPVTQSKQSHTGSNLTNVSNLEESSLESLGAYGGSDEPSRSSNVSQFHGGESDDPDLGQMVDSIRIEGKMLQRMLNTDTIDQPFQDILPVGATGFGVIKDISVSNIHVEDDDKTKDFLKKDFSGISLQTRTKVVDRGNGRLFAANTPGEDEKVFSLVSPESDFSESSSSEVWGYRPEIVTIQMKEQTPETDSSVDGCSYADLPNQNAHYKQADSLDEQSPVVGEESKTTNLIGAETDTATGNQMSIIEMTENLLQMTLEMQEKIDKDLNTHVTFSHQQTQDETFNDQVIDLQNSEDFPEPPSGWINNDEDNREMLIRPQPHELEVQTEPMLQTGEYTDVVALDGSPVTVETEFSVNAATNEETVTTTDSRNSDSEKQTHTESRSTFV